MLRKLLPHAAIVISGMYFVFFFIDRVNSAMAFINNRITKGLLFVLCVISVVNACLLIRDERRKIRQQQAQAAARRRNAQSQHRAERPAPSQRRRPEPGHPEPGRTYERSRGYERDRGYGGYDRYRRY